MPKSNCYTIPEEANALAEYGDLLSNDSQLIIWRDDIILLIDNHPDQMLVSEALRLLNNALKQQPAPNSKQLQQRKQIIDALKTHDKPVQLIQHLLQLNRKIKPVSEAIKCTLFQAFVTHPNQDCLVPSLLKTSNANLLIGTYAQKNFDNLLQLAHIWYGDSSVATLLNELPASKLTQNNFDSLVAISLPALTNSVDLETMYIELKNALSNMLSAINRSPTRAYDFNAREKLGFHKTVIVHENNTSAVNATLSLPAYTSQNNPGFIQQA